MLGMPGDHCTGLSVVGLVHVHDFCPGKLSMGRSMAALFGGKVYETEYVYSGV